MTPQALSRLQEHDFPGNARELENTIERSLALCEESEIKVHHLPADLSRDSNIPRQSVYEAQPKKSLEENEREYILSVLKSVDGNKTQAAKIIGIDRVSLWRKLKKYDKMT
jgi:DNA-binding NtrC family response regulator